MRRDRGAGPGPCVATNQSAKCSACRYRHDNYTHTALGGLADVRGLSNQTGVTSAAKCELCRPYPVHRPHTRACSRLLAATCPRHMSAPCRRKERGKALVFQSGQVHGAGTQESCQAPVTLGWRDTQKPEALGSASHSCSSALPTRGTLTSLVWAETPALTGAWALRPAAPTSF